MSDELIVAIPFLVAPLVLLLAFTGCTRFTTDDTENVGSTSSGSPGPPSETTPTPPVTGTPATPKPDVYRDLVAATTGYTASWRFDEPGGNLAADSGPNALNAILGGGFTLARPGALAHGGTAVELDGKTGVAERAYDAKLNLGATLAFSVVAWVRFTTAPAAGATVFEVLVSSRELTATVSHGFELAVTRKAGQQTSFRARVFASPTGTPSTVSVDVPADVAAPGVWRQVVLTYRNKALNLYVTVAGTPGIFTATPLATATYLPAKAGTWRMGAGHQVAATQIGSLTGQLDEIAFFQSELSSAQVSALATAAATA